MDQTPHRREDDAGVSVRRNLFVTLAMRMVLFGLMVGVVFPFLAVWLGMSPAVAYTPRFFFACLVAGTIVAGCNWWLARQAIGTPLGVLARQLEHLSARVREASDNTVEMHALREDAHNMQPSRDELGRTQVAFSRLLDVLVEQGRFRSLITEASDVVTVVSRDSTARYYSPSVTTTLGYAATDLLGESFEDLVHPDDYGRLVEAMDLLASDSHLPAPTVQLRLRHAADHWVPVESRVGNLTDEPGVQAFVLTSRDVTERRALEERLRKQAFTDPLTGLANRALFMERVSHVVDRTVRHPFSAAVVFLDLDDFKTVNDGHGHAVGDELLVEVGIRIRRCLRPGDTAARLGGDEFGVLLEDLDPPLDVGDALDFAEARGVANRLTAALVEPFDIAGHRITTSGSVGFAVADGRASADTLLRQADLAMYTVKSSGKGRVAQYHPTMTTSAP